MKKLYIIKDPSQDLQNIEILLSNLNKEIDNNSLGEEYNVSIIKCDGIKDTIEMLITQDDTRVIILNVDLTKNSEIVKNIRNQRKDIFVVMNDVTLDFPPQMQYIHGLELLKTNSINLILSRDEIRNLNMIIAPEETKYSVSYDIKETIGFLAKMIISRMKNNFTRSSVINGEAINWNSNLIPMSLRTVVNHCINNGAYKTVLGKTAGHFAVKINDTEILTSIRKTNFNELDKVGLVKIESKNENEVIAHGFRPSVGGQSQRIVFKEHPESDCIVHFHSPLMEEFRSVISIKPQWGNECGSHECGKNTSDGLNLIDLGDGDVLKVVYLDEHGPNIVFNHLVPPQKIIDFIESHFDLQNKTGDFNKFQES
jgi:hypothetical protein